LEIVREESQESHRNLKKYWWFRAYLSVRNLFSEGIRFLGLPPFIRDFHYHDLLTDQVIRIETGKLFTIVTVNGRDYWFDRFGRFGGTGGAPGDFN